MRKTWKMKKVFLFFSLYVLWIIGFCFSFYIYNFININKISLNLFFLFFFFFLDFHKKIGKSQFSLSMRLYAEPLFLCWLSEKRGGCARHDGMPCFIAKGIFGCSLLCNGAIMEELELDMRWKSVPRTWNFSIAGGKKYPSGQFELHGMRKKSVSLRGSPSS